MRAVTKHEFVFLLHLASLSVVAMAPVGVFFGVGFLLLAPPDRAASPAESASLPLALEAQEAPPPRNDEAGWGSTSALPADNVAASPLLSTLPLSNAATAGPLNRKAPALESTAMKPALMPPAGITHAKRIGVERRRHQVTERPSAALWRPDARAGPLPGGGFYGSPNVNIGYINPNGAR
jgi:hypothetical protein